MACSSAMIHSSKNTYFQMQMISSMSRMYYSLYTNTMRKNLNMYLIVQLRLLMHASLFCFGFFFNTLLYFSYIVPQLFAVQPSLMNPALGLLYCILGGDIFLV